MSFEFLPRTGFGGAAALYTDLANALARLEHEVTVLAGNNRPGTLIEESSGVTLHCFGSRRLRPRPLACAERAFRVLVHLNRINNEYGPFDVLESPELSAETLLVNSISQRCPSATRLVTPHYLLHKMNEKRRLLTVDWMERKNASLSDVVIGDSRRWAERILDDWRIDRSKLRMCPLGINLDRIDNAKSVPIPVDGPYVLFAGRLTFAKGPQILAEAIPSVLREHHDTKFLFVGGDTRTASGESVKGTMDARIPPESRRSVTFLGFLDSWDQLVSVYRGATVSVKADIYTNHSYDTIGQMACARPIVCSKTGAHEEMIDNGNNGFLFDRSDSNALADTINRLLADRALRDRIGRNARKTVEDRYTSTIMARESIKIYERLRQ